MEKVTHIVCTSGGEASALVAIHCAEKYGRENVLLLNHDIKTGIEDDDIKRFKRDLSAYLGIQITYANYKGITDPDKLPDQFDVCMEAGAITDDAGNALCTHRLKTKHFLDFLRLNFPVVNSLFETAKKCIIYYGFDEDEEDRVTRRVSIMGALGYKTMYPIYTKDLQYKSVTEVGLTPPNTYSKFKHANCIGCLKAGLVHWYCVYCLRPDVYDKACLLEVEVDYTINTVTRNKVKTPISLEELREVYEEIKAQGIEPTEHQSSYHFGVLLRSFQIEACDIDKPCACTDSITDKLDLFTL